MFRAATSKHSRAYISYLDRLNRFENLRLVIIDRVNKNKNKFNKSKCIADVNVMCSTFTSASVFCMKNTFGTDFNWILYTIQSLCVLWLFGSSWFFTRIQSLLRICLPALSLSHFVCSSKKWAYLFNHRDLLVCFDFFIFSSSLNFKKTRNEKNEIKWK